VKKREWGYRYGTEIHIPGLLNAMESGLKATMDKRHRSVIEAQAT